MGEPEEMEAVATTTAHAQKRSPMMRFDGDGVAPLLVLSLLRGGIT